jgi:hypothetical protein
MTEDEWVKCTRPFPMLDFLGEYSSHRKARLFACGCCRHIWERLGSELSREAVEATEGLPDATPLADDDWQLGGIWDRITFIIGDEPSEEDGVAWSLCRTVKDGWGGARLPATETFCLAPSITEACQFQAALLRCIMGPLPFRPVSIPSFVRTWNDGTVVNLAEAAYEQRAMPSGLLDSARLAVLADAVEEAGCDDPEILGHLRTPSPHTLGCWPIDLLLGKS